MTAEAAAAEVAPVATAANPPPASRRRARKWLVRLGLVALGVIAVTRAAHPADFARAVALVKHAGWPISLVLLPTGVAMAVDARGWQLILRAMGERAPWLPLAALRLSTEAVVLALPGGAFAGEAMKIALLRRRGGVPIPVGGASLSLTKACLIGAEAAYLIVGATWGATATLAGAGPPSRTPMLLALGGAAFTSLVSGAMFALLRNAALADRLRRVLARVPVSRFRRWIEARRTGFEDVDHAARRFFSAPLSLRARCFAAFVLEWLVEGAETLLVLRCLGSPLGIGAVLMLDGVGSLLRALVFFVPAGLGFQDAAQILLLGALGVHDPQVLGAALIVAKRSKEVFWVVTGASFLTAKRVPWREFSSSAVR